MSRSAKYSLAFVILLILQVLIFNNIQFSGYVNPFVYVMFIIILPIGIPSWIVLLLCFFTGFVVDAFSGTSGIHTFATVLAGFARPWLLSLNVTHENTDEASSLSIRNNGFRWFLVFTVMVVFVHHTALFYVEVFSFGGFFRTLLRVLLSTAFSTFFIVLLDLIRSHR